MSVLKGTHESVKKITSVAETRDLNCLKEILQTKEGRYADKESWSTKL
jgi:hypothetical protein